jgi:hypothetical protein
MGPHRQAPAGPDGAELESALKEILHLKGVNEKQTQAAMAATRKAMDAVGSGMRRACPSTPVYRYTVSKQSGNECHGQ